MNVTRASTAGFCMGVSLALRKLDNAIDAHTTSHGATERICTFGPIIHNPQVLAAYKQKGVHCLEGTQQVQNKDLVVIRAHGVTRQDEQQITQQQARIIDATCPRVKNAQLSIERATSNGSHLLLFGDADHPEVRGLISYAQGKSIVFPSLHALRQEILDKTQSWVLASQTTQDASEFKEICAYLRACLPSLVILDTICDATGQRQKEARAIAATVECMVIVGGKQSGNTRRLAEIAAEMGVTTYHVEDISELTKEQFIGIHSIGLTAGASTPKALIDAAEDWLKSLS